MAVIQYAIQWHLWAGYVYTLCNACDPVDFHLDYMLPEVFTHPLDAPVDVHGLPIDPPQGSLTGLVLGACQTTIYLWHNLTVTPLGSWLNWGGAGTLVLCMADTLTQGNASL